jgi:hypothetical protein
MGRTSIMAIAGGTFSSIGGGKFSNGAFGGAMTHLFNAEIKSSIMGGKTQEMEDKAKYHTKEARMARGKTIYDKLQTYSEPLIAAGLTGLVVSVGGVALSANALYYYAPVTTPLVGDVIQSYFAPAPKLNFPSATSWMTGMINKGALGG